MWTCFVLAINITAGDVFVVENAQTEFGWSIEWSAMWGGLLFFG